MEWLFHHIEGFQDRREARKYASNLLKAGFIRHTVNKITFSEQCYYVFGDLSDCENCEYLENRCFLFILTSCVRVLSAAVQPWDDFCQQALPASGWLIRSFHSYLPTRHGQPVPE